LTAASVAPKSTESRSGAGARLVILPALRLTRMADGEPAITRKFIEGVREYTRWWPGTVTVLMEQSERAPSNLDEVAVRGLDLGFELRTAEYGSGGLERGLRGAAVCLGAASFGQERAWDACRRTGTAYVIATENTLRTRVQMARTGEPSVWKRWRRVAWEIGRERAFRRAVGRADGLQCNGTPTLDAYRTLSARPLLYFDTRVTGAMLATNEDAASRGSAGLLRLVFSGRLVPIKGVDHLPEIAADLSRRGVDFTMTICGDGPLGPALRARVEELGLGSRVRFTGVLDFATELVPLVRRECDVFVCCHRQGDPSCTYLETMSCGVPIAGYANEAMAGLARESGSGWTVGLDDWRGLAALIAELEKDRPRIAVHAVRALGFAREHTFEKTFERRTRHLLETARQRGTVSS